MYLFLSFFLVWCAICISVAVYNKLKHRELNYDHTLGFTATCGGLVCALGFVISLLVTTYLVIPEEPYTRGGYITAVPFDPQDKTEGLPTICRNDQTDQYIYHIRRDDRSYGEYSVDISQTKVYFDAQGADGRLNIWDSKGHWTNWGYKEGKNHDQRFELHVPESMEFRSC